MPHALPPLPRLAELRRREALLLALSAALPVSAQVSGHASGPTSGQGLAPVPLLVGDGTPTGPTLRMLSWLAGQADLAWDLRPTPWLRAQRQAAAGDGVMYGLGRTPTREAQLQFSLPVWTNHTWAVVRDGDQPQVQRYADLAGQPVCWARGSSYGELFEHAGLGRMLTRESNDDDTAMRMVAAGRCRAALLTLEAGQLEGALAHAALRELKARGLALAPQPMAPAPLHFACGHDSAWRWVLPRLDAVIARSRAELDRLRQS